MELTVVIPVFNGAGTLPFVLRALWDQRRRAPHCVIVVDDGSTDATPHIITTALRHYGRTYLRSVRQRRQGVAAARNTGAGLVQTPLVLFLGADVRPHSQCLVRHLALHARHSDPHIGCLGFVTWDSHLPPSPFMIFLEHGGPQNAYGRIAGKAWVDSGSFFYGAHVSMKHSFFERGDGFDAAHFSLYGWEDLEFGIRLHKRGFRLYYEPSARADHLHHVSVSLAEERMRTIGRGAVVLQHLHPSVPAINWRREKMIHPFRLLCFPSPVRRSLSWLARAAQRRWILPRLYQRILSLAFYDGVHASERLDEGECG